MEESEDVHRDQKFHADKERREETANVQMSAGESFSLPAFSFPEAIEALLKRKKRKAFQDAAERSAVQ